MTQFFFLKQIFNFCLLLGLLSAFAPTLAQTQQYVLVNRAPGAGWNQSNPDSFKREDFEAIKAATGDRETQRVRGGISFIFSYLHSDSEVLKNSLRRFLHRAQETDTPVLIVLDGENWWSARPDLWNWWDKSKPGFNPDNRFNVEWTGWSPNDAVKIAWRNWGRQIRVLPPPNLMSRRYRAACHQQQAQLIPIILDWARQLPAQQKGLFIGIKLGWESSIGVNAWHYPNGNALLDKPENGDPQTGLNTDILPSRGAQTIGYAAVKTARIRTQGAVTEADLSAVVQRHLADLCRHAAKLGVPREKLWTHVGGWKKEELLYGAALNPYSCPGWSFYHHAGNPKEDSAVQNALKKTDAPFWAAVEWLYLGPRETVSWQRALGNTLADTRCRFVCIYNWESIRNSEPILTAIRQITAQP
jgi:hypothetical protein